MATIHAQNLWFRYPGTGWIFEDFTLDFGPFPDKGFVLAIMGASGCGKTTLLRLLLDLESPTVGRLKVDHDSGVSYLPQETVIFDHLSARENVYYFEKIGKNRDRFDGDLVNQLVMRLGLEEVCSVSRPISDLSGGERQRVALVRALSCRPSLLLLDEPLTGVDASRKREFLEQLQILVSELGLVAVYVTHQAAEAEYIADQLVFLLKHEGRGVTAGRKGSVLDLKASPPSADAFEALCFPNGNRLQCCLALDDVRGQHLSLDNGSASSTLMFDQAAVKNSESSLGFRATVVTIKNSQIFLRIQNGGLLRAYQSEFPEATRGGAVTFQLDGAAMLFSGHEKEACDVQLETNRITQASDRVKPAWEDSRRCKP